jgi:hypothetical protein
MLLKLYIIWKKERKRSYYEDESSILFYTSNLLYDEKTLHEPKTRFLPPSLSTPIIIGQNAGQIQT